MTPARLLVPLSLALLAACAQQPKQIISLEDQKDCPITLETGQTLLLMLPSNPTTGHRWLIEGMSVDHLLRQLLDQVPAPRQ